jgi:uncharacterized damage-inducible protein DinB
MKMRVDRLFDYDDWANREELSRLSAVAAPPAAAVRLISHIVSVQWLWLARLGWSGSKMEVWPDLTLLQCAKELDWLRDAWHVMLRDADPKTTVEYRNSKGETWSNAIEDIFAHVPIHGGYHRGQIATVLRSSGEEPPYTDFIHAARSGFLPDE